MSRQQTADEGGFDRALIPKLSGDDTQLVGTSMVFLGALPVCMVAWAKIRMHDGVLLQTMVMILNWTSPMNTT